jgi:hypothetical protein
MVAVLERDGAAGMFGISTESGRPALLLGTLKVAALIVGVFFLAANWLSAGPLDRLASHATGFEDPVTTGSIARAGNQTRLDPCAAPRRP